MVKGHYTYFLASSHQRYFTGFFAKTLGNFATKVCRLFYSIFYLGNNYFIISYAFF